MAITVTGVYDSMDKVLNAVDELVSSGIPREEIYVDEDSKRVLVTTAADIEPTITDLLKRHDPIEIKER